VDIAEIAADDTVLEIGPERWADRLPSQVARQVVAVELDGRLMPVLEQALSPYSNVRLVQGDILALDPARLLDSQATCSRQHPYYITSALIRHLLEARNQPGRLC